MGPEHARIAIEAAHALLRATGHENPDGPRIPVGVGVHTGAAFVGKVGNEGVTDFTVLGDAPVIASRLSSIARAGEILISEAAVSAAHLNGEDAETRTLELKGISTPVKVWAQRVSPPAS